MRPDSSICRPSAARPLISALLAENFTSKLQNYHVRPLSGSVRQRVKILHGRWTIESGSRNLRLSVRITELSGEGDNDVNVAVAHGRVPLASLDDEYLRALGLVTQPSASTLTVRTVPANAQVRVATNAGIAYHHGMHLQSGTYDVTVEAQGHEPLRQRLAVDGPSEYRIALCRLESRTEEVCKDREATSYRTETRTQSETLSEYDLGEPSDYLSANEQERLNVSIYQAQVTGNLFFLDGLRNDLTRGNCQAAMRKVSLPVA